MKIVIALVFLSACSMPSPYRRGFERKYQAARAQLAAAEFDGETCREMERAFGRRRLGLMHPLGRDYERGERNALALAVYEGCPGARK